MCVCGAVRPLPRGSVRGWISKADASTPDGVLVVWCPRRCNSLRLYWRYTSYKSPNGVVASVPGGGVCAWCGWGRWDVPEHVDRVAPSFVAVGCCGSVEWPSVLVDLSRLIVWCGCICVDESTHWVEVVICILVMWYCAPL